ncbi:MAG TPA: acyl-CoA dehydrogenase family protein [Candidatus Acidoferrales bacterium]|nr:acyl-CoA dehydrogenase family protein [Candidatus Acidoferrales bacterium]
MTTPQDVREDIVATVRRFVEREVIPVASELEHRNEYPHALVKRLKELGLFGATIPQEYGGLELDVTTYAMVVEELCKGWMSLSGVLNTHLMLAFMLKTHASDEQKHRYLPGMASGEHHGALCLTEPHAGSDVQRIRTTAVRRGDTYVLNGSKMFITNARSATLYAIAAKTDSKIDPPYKGISMFVGEKGPGLTVSRDLEKLGYKGIETCEVNMEDYHVPAANLIGGKEGQGFLHVMSGLEVGRINIAARAVGVATAAFQHAIRYAQQRETFGKPIAEHQAIQLKLADMATKIEAARLLTYAAADKKDRGERCDVEAGMAKLFASETCLEVSIEAMRILGGYGYTAEFPVERFYRDAPLMIIGEGTNEIQRLVIAKQLLQRHKI